MIQTSVTTGIVIVALFFGAASFDGRAQEAPSILRGVLTAEQADRGKAAYQTSCAACHGANLMSRSDDAPSLAAPDFALGWQGKTVGALFDRISTTMPLGEGATLTRQQYVDIVAFVLNFNGYPAGSQELKADATMLNQIVIAPLP